MNRKLQGLLLPGVLLLIALIACMSSSITPGSNSSATGVPPASGPVFTSTPKRNMPGELPADQSGHVGDQDSSTTAKEKRAPGGDRFTFGRFERPFNANTMDVYYPYEDIQDTFIYQDNAWLYSVIKLKGGDASQKLPARYGVEIDSDLDGRGDWLITADAPSSSGWSTEGVRVFFDANNDVGGKITVNADDQSAGDGYETTLFDQGQGNDPDLAWARVSPQDPNTVEIAVKRSLLGGDDSFMAGMWAGNANSVNPARFDLNDHMTHAQAGTSLVELKNFYPIKDLAELDNSCRMPVGFQPTGNEPGSCPVAPPGPCPPQYLVCVNLGAQQICYCTQP